MPENAGLITKARDLVDANYVATRQQFQGIIYEDVNTGSPNENLLVYPRNYTLQAISVQNNRVGSSGSGVISILFGSGASFVAVPGLSSRTVTTTNTVYNVTGSGQLVTTSQQLQVQFVSVTSGPINVAIYFYFSEQFVL